MAEPTIIQKNILDAEQQKATMVLQLRTSLTYITQMWTNEGLATLTDMDIQSLPTFTGVTATEALAAKQALDAILTTIGDPGVVGSNAYKLLKIVYNIP